MKKLLFILYLPLLCLGQEKQKAEAKVEEGIPLHDKGNYTEAIAKYDEALQLDANNFLALNEKALTLSAANHHEEAIALCQVAIKAHPEENASNLYVTYGNSLDHLKQVEQALAIYNEGIEKYPDFYQLHFNKGITLANANDLPNAVLSFEYSAKLNPNHGSSINALGVLNRSNRIAAILASCRYLILDNQSTRAKANWSSLTELMSQGVSKKEDQSISITFTADQLNKENTPNNFSNTDLILSMAAALDHDPKFKNKTDCEKFISKFTTICHSLEETRKTGNGYFWDYLAPYFIAMEKEKLIEPFAYYIYYPSKSEDVISYYQKNSKQIEKLIQWSQRYSW